MKQLGFSKPSKTTKYCEECVLSKSTRNAFNDHLSRNKAIKLLERLHMDLAFINQQYVLGILDEFSRKPFIFILNSKSEAPQKVIDLLNFMENQTTHKVKSIHSDNGSEFVNSTISEFCKTKGIKQTTSVSYTPQNNGLAERMWRSLLNTTRSLIFQSQIPQTFVNDAILTACFLLQYRPNQKRQNQNDKTKTVFEMRNNHPHCMIPC